MKFDDILDEALEEDNRDENEENLSINSPVLESGRSGDYQVYNGAFKDIYTNCPQLLIPLVNEMFGTINIPCFIVPDYSLDDLIDNNLIIAFPFYMVKYENFLQGKSKESKQRAIENDLEVFYNGLEKAITNGIITEIDFQK